LTHKIEQKNQRSAEKYTTFPIFQMFKNGHLPSNYLFLVVDLDLCQVCLLIVANFDGHFHIAVQDVVVSFSSLNKKVD